MSDTDPPGGEGTPEPPAAVDAAPPVQPAPPSDLAGMLAGTELPTEEILERAEAKPPRYRLVRGAIYATYMVLVAWFCIAVTVAVWRAVWGASGQQLQAHEAQSGPALQNCKE